MIIKMIKRLISINVVFICVLSSLCFAFTGEQIVENAERYRSYVWKCWAENVRVENRDDNVNTNNYTYPFWPEGQLYKLKGTTTPLISDGWNTGVAYAWGLRELFTVFGGTDGKGGKLAELNNNGNRYLAGELNEVNWN
ncbi:MAG TPA: hypothetical protein PLB12_11565, partial [Candidatus Goldiibacteriota bacterium]|nr:hypothetical protein [Candidatus Goldiibacteriota bacterium]